MVSLDSKIFVSTKKFECKNVTPKQIADKKDDFFTLSMNTRYKSFNFVPIDEIEINSYYSGTLVDVDIVSGQGNKYKLTVTPSCEFVTGRGNVNAHKINELDVFYDNRGIKCKLVKKTFYEATDVPMVHISSSYTYNFLCNNVLVKDNK